MKLNLYLPDEIGERAKAVEPELNLSRLLRDAVEAELRRRELVTQMLAGACEIELDLRSSSDESPYTGVLTGIALAENVYLTSDERLMVYDTRSETLEQVEDLEELRWIGDEDYITVCAALGKPARMQV